MTTCFTSNSKTTLFVSIILHVLILFFFLSVFFRMYISKLETQKFQYEINDIISNNLNNSLIQYDQNNNEQLKQFINKPDNQMVLSVLNTMYSNQDAVTQNNNDWVFKFNIVLGVLILTSFIITIGIIYLSCDKCVSLMNIILENIITFIFVGIIEFLFFTQIAFKFIPIPPSLLIKSFYQYTQDSLLNKI